MGKHFIREIEKVNRDLLAICTLAEESVFNAVKSVIERDSQLAQNVLDADDVIDQKEVELEEECLKILALHQPVAVDLRFIVAVLKINNDLERIGDLAVNIASRARSLAKMEAGSIPIDLSQMAEKTKAMLRRSIDSLVQMSTDLAYEVTRMDDEVDMLHKQNFAVFLEHIPKNPALTNYCLSLLSVSRNLERIADLATNIAEDVIYTINGQIVRHRLSRIQNKA
jgi:phosphate transport system protein